MSGDFASLYTSLGISPESDVERVKLMFRKRISELHPDRSGGLSEEELLQLYFKALRFHRRHGRFPGGRVPPRATACLTLSRQQTQGDATASDLHAESAANPHHESTVQRSARSNLLHPSILVPALTLLALLILGVAIWNTEESPRGEVPPMPKVSE